MLQQNIISSNYNRDYLIHLLAFYSRPNGYLHRVPFLMAFQWSRTNGKGGRKLVPSVRKLTKLNISIIFEIIKYYSNFITKEYDNLHLYGFIYYIHVRTHKKNCSLHIESYFKDYKSTKWS